MPTIRETLMKFTNDHLVELLFHLMDTLNEKERMKFISEHINAENALEATGSNNGRNLLRRVSMFCEDCLNGDYYIEPEYDDHYYGELYYNMDESEWAREFTECLELATTYSRNRAYDVSYQAFDKLLECLHEAEIDEGLLGTDDPASYINVDWVGVFEEYFVSMKNEISDKEQLTNKAIDAWMSFGARCSSPIHKHLDDIILIEKAIRKNIKDNTDAWVMQHKLYKLLKGFYNTLGVEFHELATATSMMSYNPNFLNDVAQAYMDREMWEEAVKVIKGTFHKVKASQVIDSLNTKLVDSYEKLGIHGEAFDVAVKMFCANGRHDLYKRARFFGEKLGSISTFVDSMEAYILSHQGDHSLNTLLRILSFEGRTEKLVGMALESNGYSRHDYLKYTCKALIYRALGSEKVSHPNLVEYIQSVENTEIPGIVDMIKLPEDLDKKEYLLSNAIEILKIMVQFHIDAATRSRYRRAAYYCIVIKDVYTYLGKNNEFHVYYGKVLQENSRKTALKDEFKRKIR